MGGELFGVGRGGIFLRVDGKEERGESVEGLGDEKDWNWCWTNSGHGRCDLVLSLRCK